MVGRRLAAASRRDLLGNRGQALLSVLGVALGVAVMVAVDLANESARRAFALSLQTLAGKATHQVSGGDAGIPEGFYRLLRVERGLRASAPVVQGLVRLDGETFHLLGIDPFADAAVRPDMGSGSGTLGEEVLRRLLTEPAAVLMGERDLARLGLVPGDAVALEAAGQVHSAHVVARLTGPNPAALEGVLVADIATAQAILGRIGRLTRIDLVLDDARAAALAGTLPPDLSLAPAEGRDTARLRMTEAFHTNLAAMGLLALLVGMLLVYNTMTFSVLRRRPLLGMLRVLGATRRDLFALVLLESLALGLVGTLLGLALGVALGQGLVKLVVRTINDLYFVLTVSSLLVSPGVLLKGFAVGLAATLAAAAVPAWEAAATTPQAATRRMGLERGVHRAVPWLAGAGLVLMLAAVAAVQLSTRGLAVAFGALFLFILGFALLVPGAVLAFSRGVSPAVARLFGSAGRLAARGIAAGLSRSGMAVAALTVAVSATVGVGMMVESFRETVADWLRQTLSSDIYVSLPGAPMDQHRTSLPACLIDDLRALPGVGSVSTGRPREVETEHGPATLLAMGRAAHVPEGFRFDAAEPGDPWGPLRAGRSVFVSQPYAFHHRVAPGDSVTLETPRGSATFRVGAVFYDYSRDRGMLLMDRPTYARLWDDPGVTTAGLRLRPEADRQAVLARVHELVAALEQPVLVRANAAIRAESMAVFDRTFAITGVLRLLAIGVAFIGVLSALLALQLERAREHAMLRALGVTPGQLTGLVSLECGLMGLAAGLLALPLGWVMAELLIHVVNLRSFGWSMRSVLPPAVLAEALALALVAALLAGLYPAWHLARTAPAAALRDE